jgi:TRAP-type C4-dicarboxylate transport system substrate-binding protein
MDDDDKDIYEILDNGERVATALETNHGVTLSRAVIDKYLYKTMNDEERESLIKDIEETGENKMNETDIKELVETMISASKEKAQKQQKPSRVGGSSRFKKAKYTKKTGRGFSKKVKRSKQLKRRQTMNLKKKPNKHKRRRVRTSRRT